MVSTISLAIFIIGLVLLIILFGIIIYQTIRKN